MINELQIMQRSYEREQRQKAFESLPMVTLSAPTETGQAESTIPVLRQRSYTARKSILPSSAANTPCADLGVHGVLKKLNGMLCTSYSLDTSLKPYEALYMSGWHKPPTHLDLAIKPYITQNCDFGTAYARLRGYWEERAITGQLGDNKDEEMKLYCAVNGKDVEVYTYPRRVWDLYANRVVPWWVARPNQWAISHAWVDEEERIQVWTPINGYEWPVPMPKDCNLDLIRIEMLNLGAQYVWLDVLCLRQEYAVREDHREEDLHKEDLRKEEWKVDVPLIGAMYEGAPRVVCYFSGLGLPLSLKPGYFESDRCWFRRAWTLQEIKDNVDIGGETGNGGSIPKDMQKRFDSKLASLRRMRKDNMMFDVLAQMQDRVSTKALDKVAGLAYLLHLSSPPSYIEGQSEEEAWVVLVNLMDIHTLAEFLLFYPEPGNGDMHWRPSWRQVMKRVPSVKRSSHTVGAIDHTEDPDAYWYDGLCIDSCDVRGLNKSGSKKPRYGWLDVKDDNGAMRSFQIVANHAYPIPNGGYMLLGGGTYGERMMDISGHFWAVGTKQPDGKFKKLSVFAMASDGERAMLRKLGVKVGMHKVKTCLC